MNTDKQEYTPQATYFAEMVARHASLQGDTVFLELLRALVQSSDEGNSALDVRNWESPCREEALKRLEGRDSAWSCAVAEDGCEDMLHPLVWVSSTGCLYLLKNRLAEKQIAAYVASSLAKTRNPPPWLLPRRLSRGSAPTFRARMRGTSAGRSHHPSAAQSQ